jgi:hypothetical protein
MMELKKKTLNYTKEYKTKISIKRTRINMEQLKKQGSTWK